MKKILSGIIAFFALAVVAVPAFAAVNAVTPSTNDLNRDKGWAHVNVLNATTDEITLEFVSTRGFASCFEYREDGESSQYGNIYPHPIVIGDYYYYYKCISNETFTKTFYPDEYVEIRMTFGAEGDERFDWTRFDLLFNRYAEITSPGAGEILTSGDASFDAVLYDKDGNDGVQWAVRKGTCAAGQGTVYGNVDGYNDSYDWDGMTFHSQTDVSGWENGDYCFVFNPRESSGDTPVRETQEFAIANPPSDQNQCKKGGWEDLNDHLGNTFKNQGDCVSYVSTDGKNLGAGPSIFE